MGLGPIDLSESDSEEMKYEWPLSKPLPIVDLAFHPRPFRQAARAREPEVINVPLTAIQMAQQQRNEAKEQLRI